jgi:hypothetical protein
MAKDVNGFCTQEGLQHRREFAILDRENAGYQLGYHEIHIDIIQ